MKSQRINIELRLETHAYVGVKCHTWTEIGMCLEIVYICPVSYCTKFGTDGPMYVANLSEFSETANETKI
jgi:hypothetical protein